MIFYKVCRNKKTLDKKGMVTIPFLLAGIIMLFFILSFFYLSMTLAHISVTQYLSYSAGRKLALDNENLQAQKDASKEQYQKLREKFFKESAWSKETDWFEINIGDAESGTGLAIGTSLGEKYEEKNKIRTRFYGIHLGFMAYKVRFNIPFISKKKDTPLDARVTSFLGREPTLNECNQYHKARSSKLIKDSEGFKNSCEGECPGLKIKELTADNGC